MSGFTDTSSLLWRSGSNHHRYFSPAAVGMDPPVYAGKVESVCATMALDVLGVDTSDMPDPAEFACFLAGFNLVVRANDEVIDEAMPYTDETITPDVLNSTPIFHPFAGPGGRLVTGEEGMDIAMDAAANLIPGNSIGSIRRREAVEEMLQDFTAAMARTANNPSYNTGDSLDFLNTLKTKDDTNGILGRLCVGLFATLIDHPERETDRRLFERIAVAMQFGDDLFDWRKDWLRYRTKQEATDRPVRPQQNLFTGVLQDHPSERQACEAALTDRSRRSVLLARERAPETLAAFYAELRDVMGQFPAHPYRDKATRIVNFLVGRVIPLLPESGRVASWAKY